MKHTASQTLTMGELLALTTIKDCTECGLRHAPVRTCEEARIEEEFNAKSD